MQDFKPFLKWAGGKSRIAHKIDDCIPSSTRRIIEPFVGGTSVSLRISANSYLLADTNSDLISTYKYLVENPARFIGDCQVLFDGSFNSSQKYYELREEFNTSSDSYRRACIFVYLNRHCFNGLIRFNANGHFNTPFGKYELPKFPHKEMRLFAERFKVAEFLVSDFRMTMTKAGQGDFVYCDPPYTPIGKLGFTAYAKGGFLVKDHEDLVVCCQEAAKRGACVVISNHDTPETRVLYTGATELFTLNVKRTISCKGDARYAAAELIAVYDDGKISGVQ